MLGGTRRRRKFYRSPVTIYYVVQYLAASSTLLRLRLMTPLYNSVPLGTSDPATPTPTSTATTAYFYLRQIALRRSHRICYGSTDDINQYPNICVKTTSAPQTSGYLSAPKRSSNGVAVTTIYETSTVISQVLSSTAAATTSSGRLHTGVIIGGA